MAFWHKDVSFQQAVNLPSSIPAQHLEVLRRTIVGRPRKIESIQSCPQQIYLVTTHNGTRSLVKFPPLPTIKLLRHEQNTLAIEEHLLRYNRLSATSCRLQTYERLPSADIPSYLHVNVGNGMPFHNLGQIDESKSTTIQRSLWMFMMSLTSASGTSFGPEQPDLRKRLAEPWRVSWRNAFEHMVECLLLDAEDLLVHVPYQQIRHYIRHHGHVLYAIATPKLVFLDAMRKSNVLVEPLSYQVKGLIETWNAVWGDPELALCGLGPTYFGGLAATLLPRADEAARTRRLL